MKRFLISLLLPMIVIPLIHGCVVVAEDGDGYYAPEIYDPYVECGPAIDEWYFYTFVDDLDGVGDVYYVNVEAYWYDVFEEDFDLDYLDGGEWEWYGYSAIIDCDYFEEYEFCFYAEDYMGNWDEVCI